MLLVNKWVGLNSEVEESLFKLWIIINPKSNKINVQLHKWQQIIFEKNTIHKVIIFYFKNQFKIMFIPNSKTTEDGTFVIWLGCGIWITEHIRKGFKILFLSLNQIQKANFLGSRLGYFGSKSLFLRNLNCE